MLSMLAYYFCCIQNYLLPQASIRWERTISRSTLMLRKAIIALVAAASVGVLTPTAALARVGGGGGGGFGGGGGGVGGGGGFGGGRLWGFWWGRFPHRWSWWWRFPRWWYWRWFPRWRSWWHNSSWRWRIS